jgi:hypothetical protein
LTADMSVAPEIARLAEAALLVPPQPAVQAPAQGSPPSSHTPGTQAASTAGATQMSLGTLARQLRSIAAAPERWWGLVRFEGDRSASITVEQCAAYHAWLVILPPGDTGHRCDCHVATMIAGEAAEGEPSSAVLRPGTLRVHGRPHGLRGRGTGYSISLHARAHRPTANRPSPK